MSSDNLVFTTYAAISQSTNNESFFKKMLSSINTDKVQLLYQHTNLEIYEMLGNLTENNTNSPSFEKKVLAVIQNTDNSVFDIIIKIHFNDLYDDTKGNRVCRLILVNIMKHALITT